MTNKFHTKVIFAIGVHEEGVIMNIEEPEEWTGEMSFSEYMTDDSPYTSDFFYKDVKTPIEPGVYLFEGDCVFGGSGDFESDEGDWTWVMSEPIVKLRITSKLSDGVYQIELE